MKKLLSATVVCLLTVSSTTATAQGNLVARNDKPTIGFAALALEPLRTGSSHTITISKRVMEKFTKEFAGITDAAWVKDDNGFVVRFTSGGIQNWAFLSKQGTCQSRMRYYTKSTLPAAVRNQVEQAYENFTITSVKEVQHKKVTSYLVTIADETTWKVIQVVDGKTEVWEEHVKG
jgi:hypothetical protein